MTAPEPTPPASAPEGTAAVAALPAPAPQWRPAQGWRERLRSGLGRLVLMTLAGLILAGIVHIVTILFIPALSERDASSAYLSLGGPGHAELVSPPGAGLPVLRDADPAAIIAVCAYDLAGGPLRVVARTGTLPLGLSLHRRGGGVVYAITDRAAIRGTLEFVVLTEEQLDQRLARDEEGETVRELRVVSDTAQGLVVARVLARQASDRAEAQAMATGVACGAAD